MMQKTMTEVTMMMERKMLTKQDDDLEEDEDVDSDARWRPVSHQRSRQQAKQEDISEEDNC